MNQHDALNQAMSLSRKIIEAIDEKDWDTVTNLDSQRQKMIQGYFQNNPNIDAAQTLELKKINDDIVARLVVMQQQTRAQQVELGRANKASHAYLDNLPK